MEEWNIQIKLNNEIIYATVALLAIDAFASYLNLVSDY